MRKRSLSVAYDRPQQLDRLSKKFEGVPSEHENESETEEENDEVKENVDSDWTKTDYKALMDQLRSVVPKKDTKQWKGTLKKIDWAHVAFEGRTPDEVKAVTEELMRKIRKYRTLSEMIDDIPLHANKNCEMRKPKNPPSAYNFFVKEKYTKFKNKNPDLSSQAIFKLVLKGYANLSEKKKRKYEAMAAEAREVHKQQLEQYYLDNPEAVRKKSNSKSRNPKTPFGFFQKHKRMENPGLTSGELRSQWHSLEVKQKLKYIQQAFKSQPPDTAKPLKLTKNEQCLLEQAQGKPAPIPRSTSEYYLQHYTDKNTSSTVTTWRKEKLLDFKKLPKVRKLELEIEYRNAKLEYVNKYENYIANITDQKAQQAEIDLLKSFIEKRMDKEDRIQLPDDNRPFSSLVQMTLLENELDVLPIAESTILPKNKKKPKNATPQNGSISADNPKQKPLKSILKSPTKTSTVAKNDKHTFVEPAVPSKSKRKHSLNENDSDSSFEKKSKRSIVPVPIVEPDMKTNISKGNGTTNATAAVKLKEPVRPPNNILEYYKQNYYLGKAENCTESYKKLSTNRKENLREEMRAAQKKYFKELQKYLKTVDPQHIKGYLKKLKQAQIDFNIREETVYESDSVENSERMTKKTPKQEPQSSSGESSEESSEDENNQNGQNNSTDDNATSDDE